jgi:hypothetical protein
MELEVLRGSEHGYVDSHFGTNGWKLDNLGLPSILIDQLQRRSRNVGVSARTFYLRHSSPRSCYLPLQVAMHSYRCPQCYRSFIQPEIPLSIIVNGVIGRAPCCFTASSRIGPSEDSEYWDVLFLGGQDYVYSLPKCIIS